MSQIPAIAPYYMEQHLVLRLAGLHVRWVFDGDFFRRKYCRYAYYGGGAGQVRRRHGIIRQLCPHAQIH